MYATVPYRWVLFRSIHYWNHVRDCPYRWKGQIYLLFQIVHIHRHEVQRIPANLSHSIIWHWMNWERLIVMLKVQKVFRIYHRWAINNKTNHYYQPLLPQLIYTHTHTHSKSERERERECCCCYWCPINWNQMTNQHQTEIPSIIILSKIIKFLKQKKNYYEK